MDKARIAKNGIRLLYRVIKNVSHINDNINGR